MGYKVPAKQFRLVFDESSTLAGLEVYVKPGTVDVFLEMSKLREIKQDNIMDPETIELVKHMLTVFSDTLISWNAETEDGDPIPATYESLCKQDLTDFVMPIISAWLDAIIGSKPPVKAEEENVIDEEDIDELMASLPMELQ